MWYSLLMTNNDTAARFNASIIFETVTCTRCGGSGSYGPTQVEGGRCFTCLGTGKKFSRKGKLAKAFFEENLDLMNKAFEDIVPDDRVWMNVKFMGTVMRWVTVTESVPDALNEGRWQVRAVHKGENIGMGGVTRAYVAASTDPNWTGPSTMRVWDRALWDRAVNATLLMPGASLPAEPKVADEAAEAPVKAPVAAGTKRANGSHANCTHESTPKARATCRKARVA